MSLFFRNLTLLASFVMSILIACTGVAAQTSACDSVLALTGRETRVLYDNELRDSYYNYALIRKSDDSGHATLPIGNVPILFGFNSQRAASTANQQIENWKKEYFSYADEVFAPAVAAWLECKKAEKQGLRFVPDMSSDLSTLNVSIASGTGAPQYFEGVVIAPAHAATCTLDGQLISEATHRSVAGGVNHTLTCRRSARTMYMKVDVTARLSSSDIKTTMVAAETPLRQANLNDNQQLHRISGCANDASYAAAPYARRVHLKSLDMFGGPLTTGQQAVGYVAINGRELSHPRMNTPDPVGCNCRFSDSSGPTVDVAAYMPIHVRFETSVPNCQTGDALVYFES